MADKLLQRSALLLLILLFAVGAPIALTLVAPSSVAYADDDDGDDEEDDDKEDEEEPDDDKVDPTIREAVGEILQSGVKYKLKNGNKIELEYPLEEGSELADWESKGFDKIVIRHIESYHGGSTGPGLEIGASSRKAGFAQHSLPMTGDFTIEVEMWMAHTAPSSVVMFSLSKKVGVLWGQAICKKSGKPYSKKSRWDLNTFGRERKNKFKFVNKGGELQITVNGRKWDSRKFKKGELDKWQLGIMAKNCRVVLIDLKIHGEIDPSKL